MLVFDSHQEGLAALKTKYNEEVKPLVAQVEAVYEKTPEQLLNEVRAFADHEARCFVADVTSEDIEKEINRAEGHLTRIILDCFKYLNVYQHKEYVERFGRLHFFVDLNPVDSGNFIVKYHELVKDSKKSVKDAKACESYDKDKSLNLYQEAYNSYSDLEELVESHRRQIAWATAKSLLGTLVSFLIGAVTTVIIGLIVWGVEKEYLQKLYDGLWHRLIPAEDVVTPTDSIAPVLMMLFG